MDLNSIYPEKSNDVDFNVTLVKISPSQNFKQPASILLDHGKLYFTTNVDRPAVLKVNVYLNSNLNSTQNSHQNATLNANENATQNSTLNSTQKPTEDLRKFTKVFEIKPDKIQKKHVFELGIEGSLENILNSEKAILSEFETKLWKSGKPCKDCLSIAYITRDDGQYRIGVASTQGPSYLLDEFCFLGNIPGEYLKIMRLKVNRRFAECKPINAVSQTQTEQYVVNVFVNVSTKPLETSVRGFWNDVVTVGKFFPPVRMITSALG